MTGLRLVLASASPRRAFLLSRLGYSFDIEPTHVPEDIPPDVPAANAAGWLSRLKAESHPVAGTTGYLVLAADTVVILDGRILGKPENPDAAMNMLRLLSGKQHQVITSVTLSHSNGAETFQEETSVYFKNLDPYTMEQYVASGLPMDKAGGYGIQDGLPPENRKGTPEEMAVLQSVNCPDLILECGSLNINYPLILRLDGPFFNVMGLPVASLHPRLKGLGF